MNHIPSKLFQGAIYTTPPPPPTSTQRAPTTSTSSFQGRITFSSFWHQTLLQFPPSSSQERFIHQRNSRLWRAWARTARLAESADDARRTCFYADLSRYISHLKSPDTTAADLGMVSDTRLNFSDQLLTFVCQRRDRTTERCVRASWRIE